MRLIAHAVGGWLGGDLLYFAMNGHSIIFGSLFQSACH